MHFLDRYREPAAGRLLLPRDLAKDPATYRSAKAYAEQHGLAFTVEEEPAPVKEGFTVIPPPGVTFEELTNPAKTIIGALAEWKFAP